MDGVVFVSAVQLLANKQNWKLDAPRPGYTPLLKGDLSRFEHALASLNQNTNHSKIDLSPPDNQSQIKDVSDANNSVNDGKHQDLRLFLSISLSQQLHTVVIQNFPDNPPKIADFIVWLERFTKERFPISSEEASHNIHGIIENWSNVTSSTLDNTQNLFIRLSSVPLFPQMVLYWTMLFDTGTNSQVLVHTDENTALYIRDAAPNYTPEVSKEDIDALNEQLKEMQKKTTDSILDVGALVAYDVDMNTLSDLPRDSLSQLVKDIVEFRTRVLTMEKEKQDKEALEEGKRRRAQLKKVLEQIRKSKGTTVSVDLDDEEEDDDDDDSQDDLELERRRQERTKEAAVKEFNSMLAHVNTSLMPELRAREEQLKLLKEYDSKLLRERMFYLKELLHLGNSEYYDHKRVFKEEEEQMDNENRLLNKEGKGLSSISAHPLDKEAPPDTLLDKTESPTKPASSPALNKEPMGKEQKIKLALKKVFDSCAQEADSESEREDYHPSTAPAASQVEIGAITASKSPLIQTSDVLPFADDQLQTRLSQLRQSRLVDELVKEYLGVYEDELVDYIIDNIREHRSRNSLLTELQETFDDDSARIVDEIWRKLFS